MKILVTGSAGFIGANLVARLLDRQEVTSIVGIDNLNDYYDPALKDALGRKVVQRFLPMQPGDVPATFADTSALERDFGFAPLTPLQEGLRRFADWYKQNHGV